MQILHYSYACLQLSFPSPINFLCLTAFEFICAQSPYSMRGFMIGAFYFLSGIFGLFALLLVIVFIVAFQNYPHYDCGVEYYSTLMFIGVGTLILYTFVAYRYKRRSRQHIGNEQQMIEACYEHTLAGTNTNEEEVIHVSISTKGTHTDLDRVLYINDVHNK